MPSSTPSSPDPATRTPEPTIGALLATVQLLTTRVQTLEDQAAIKHLHHTYGYLLDSCLYTRVPSLFSNSPEASVHFHNGIWKGQEGIRRLYVEWFGTLFTKGKNRPVRGLLLDHFIGQDIITVSTREDKDQKAKGRFRCFMQGGSHESVPAQDRPQGPPNQFWEGGVYENEYVLEDGKWKILKLGYNMLWQAEYEKGWFGSVAMEGVDQCWPEAEWGPDEIVSGKDAWPERRIVGFHWEERGQ